MSPQPGPGDRRIWLPTEWDCVVSHVEKSSRQARDVVFTFEGQPTDREFRLEAPPGAKIYEMKNGVPVPR